MRLKRIRKKVKKVTVHKQKPKAKARTQQGPNTLLAHRPVHMPSVQPDRPVKIAKTIKTTKTLFKGAKGASRLLRRMGHPQKVEKMVIDLAMGKGLVLPGSNYIGPANPMGRPTKNKGDELAKAHDIAYAEYLKAGHSKKDVYTGFSKADKRLLQQSNIGTAEGFATWSGMKLKQELAKHGITKRLDY